MKRLSLSVLFLAMKTATVRTVPSTTKEVEWKIRFTKVR